MEESLRRHVRRLLERGFPRALELRRWIRDTPDMRRLQPVETELGFKVLVDPKARTRTCLYPDEAELILRELERADVFVDIGANVGLHTMLACSVGRHVVAVEPLQTNVLRLCANLVQNDYSDVEIYPMAMGERAGVATLFGSGTGASLIEGWSGTPTSYARGVPINTLDAIVATRFEGARLLVKVDAEGGELGLLRGALATLDRVPRPVWLVEVSLAQHHPAGSNPSFLDTFRLFWDHGYSAWTTEDPAMPVSSEEARRWAETGFVEFGSSNYVFR